MQELLFPGAGIALATIRLLSDWEEVRDYLTVDFSQHEWDSKSNKHVKSVPHFVTYMDCSDTFFWGGGDVEEVTEENFPILEATVAEIRPLWNVAIGHDAEVRKQETEERSQAWGDWKAADPSRVADGLNTPGWSASPEFKAIAAKYRPLIKAQGFVNAVSDLFAARAREQRPQGAAYKVRYDPSLWPLFDACGPEREVGPGNPRKPGE